MSPVEPVKDGESTVHVNELARELEVNAQVILDLLPKIGVTEKKTHSSTIDLAVAEKVRKHIREFAEAEAAKETAAKAVAEKIAQDAAAKAARLRPQPVPAPAAPATATPAAQGLVPAAGVKTPAAAVPGGKQVPVAAAPAGGPRPGVAPPIAAKPPAGAPAMAGSPASAGRTATAATLRPAAAAPASVRTGTSAGGPPGRVPLRPTGAPPAQAGRPAPAGRPGAPATFRPAAGAPAGRPGVPRPGQHPMRPGQLPGTPGRPMPGRPMPGRPMRPGGLPEPEKLPTKAEPGKPIYQRKPAARPALAKRRGRLTKREIDQILISYYREQDLYERLAKELHRILDEDTRFPMDAVYTVKHRRKDRERLIEKINQENLAAKRPEDRIDEHNFQQRIQDLLGFRIVCLRFSDLKKLKTYVRLLRVEGKIRIIRGPVQKKTFLIRPGGADRDSEKPDMQYTGYSSVHYVIRLGKSLRRAKPGLADLKVELQLRTIFEEAWGEIDHKYRYELKRAGKKVPKHVDDGFRDLSLYLQAATRQAEHLCEVVDELKEGIRGKSQQPQKHGARRRAAASPVKPTLEDVLREKIGFVPTERTLAYCRRRLLEHADHLGREFTAEDFGAALTQRELDRFYAIYQKVLGKAPFTDPDPSQRGLDIIPLVNFTIFSTVQSSQVAEAGLRATLASR